MSAISAKTIIIVAIIFITSSAYAGDGEAIKVLTASNDTMNRYNTMVINELSSTQEENRKLKAAQEGYDADIKSIAKKSDQWEDVAVVSIFVNVFLFALMVHLAIRDAGAKFWAQRIAPKPPI